MESIPLMYWNASLYTPSKTFEEPRWILDCLTSRYSHSRNIPKGSDKSGLICFLSRMLGLIFWQKMWHSGFITERFHEFDHIPESSINYENITLFQNYGKTVITPTIHGWTSERWWVVRDVRTSTFFRFASIEDSIPPYQFQRMDALDPLQEV